MRNTPKVGELLLEAGVIDQEQLDKALGEQRHWGRRLGVTLIKLGMVEENHLIRALAQQLGLPATSLAGRRIAPEVIALVPARLAIEHGVIPLFVKRNGSSGKLFLGMEDPSKLEVLDDLCFRTGLEIQPVMMGPTELGQAIDRYYLRKSEASKATQQVRSGETTIGERSLGLRDQRASTPAAPPAEESALDLQASPSRDPLDEGVERALRDTDKTRVVVKAITQLLVEKGILSLEEVQARIAKLKANVS